MIENIILLKNMWLKMSRRMRMKKRMWPKQGPYIQIDSKGNEKLIIHTINSPVVVELQSQVQFRFNLAFCTKDRKSVV